MLLCAILIAAGIAAGLIYIFGTLAAEFEDKEK